MVPSLRIADILKCHPFASQIEALADTFHDSYAELILFFQEIVTMYAVT